MIINIKKFTTMKKIKLIKKATLVLLSAILLSSVNVYSQDLTNRELPEFSGVDVSGVFNVFLTQAPVFQVQVETEGVDAHDIITEVSEGILKIDFDGSFPRRGKATLKITAPEFKSLKAGGVANIEGTNTIETASFDLNVSGASKIKLDLNTDLLKSVISGASNVHYTGKATAHNLNISGASLLRATELETKTLDVKGSGASKVEVSVKSTAKGEVSGTSNLVFETEPESIDISASGVAKFGHKKDGAVRYYDSKDTVRIKMGSAEVWFMDDDSRRKPKRRKPRFRDNWSGIDFGMNAFLNPEQSLRMKPGSEFLELEHNKSWVINFNLFQKSFPIISNNLGIYTGLGFGFNNYRLNDKSVTLMYNKEGIDYVIEDDIVMSRNKLVLTHLNIPLMLEFQTHGPKKSHRFNIAAGANLGILMSSYTRQRYEVDGNKMKRKVKENYHISPFRYELTARIGYGGVNLFATYALNTLFKTDKGPELYPFSVGISLVN